VETSVLQILCKTEAFFAGNTFVKYKILEQKLPTAHQVMAEAMIVYLMIATEQDTFHIHLCDYW
jgi:hypothetical protein